MLNERLKNLRLAKGLTLQQVGDVFGISRASVSSWESGTNQPDPRKLEKLAHLFDTNVNYLITGEGPVSFELLDNAQASKGVPFVLWDEISPSFKPRISSARVPCLYTKATQNSFATRYPGSTSLEWHPGAIPAGALLIIDKAAQIRHGVSVLVATQNKHLAIGQVYGTDSKDQLSINIVNSKFTLKIDDSINIIGVIQEWRIGGKL